VAPVHGPARSHRAADLLTKADEHLCEAIAALGEAIEIDDANGDEVGAG
jgi:hypothetical protein